MPLRARRDLPLGGFLGGFGDDLLVRLGERVPHRLRHMEDAGVGAVVPDRQVLLRQRLHLEREEQVDRVLLPVDRAGRQRGLQIGEAHLQRVGAERVEHVGEDRPGGVADLHALEILGLAHRALGIRQLAKTVLAPGERHHVAARQHLEQVLPHLAADQRVERLVVRHQERHRIERHLLDLRRQVDGRRDGEIDDALAHRDQLARLVAADQLRARIDLHVDAAVGALGDQLGPLERAFGERDRPVADHRQLVFGLELLRARNPRHRDGCAGSRAAEQDGSTGGLHRAFSGLICAGLGRPAWEVAGFIIAERTRQAPSEPEQPACLSSGTDN